MRRYGLGLDQPGRGRVRSLVSFWIEDRQCLFLLLLRPARVLA